MRDWSQFPVALSNAITHSALYQWVCRIALAHTLATASMNLGIGIDRVQRGIEDGPRAISHHNANQCTAGSTSFRQVMVS